MHILSPETDYYPSWFSGRGAFVEFDHEKLPHDQTPQKPNDYSATYLRISERKNELKLTWRDGIYAVFFCLVCIGSNACHCFSGNTTINCLREINNSTGRFQQGATYLLLYIIIIRQEAHRPQLAHLSDIATADMQMLCNIFLILSSQLMKISSFEQFLVLKKNIIWVWQSMERDHLNKLSITVQQ